MTTATGQSFGTRLRRYRLRAGLTQEELAERAELSPRGLMYLERDERRPQPGTVRRLAGALELSDRERLDFLHPPSVPIPTNLPDDPTPFIGRTRELEQVSGLFQKSHIRLVTLTGAGGSGKTRLALRVARHLPRFQDGIFFVSLAPLTDPALVPQTIAEVLGVTETAGQALSETLADALRDKRILLVLDNYEHLLDAAPVVGELLDGCRELHVLVTSRTPLHLIREHEYPVEPLPVPDPQRQSAPADLEQYDAVALFVERARAVRPDFELTAGNAFAVAQICVQLDGLPLAIELAAARLKLFSPQNLLNRLEHRLSVLTGGARDQPARQQTLRGTVDWSYSLLTEEERTMFDRLSVFAGGCTIEAAEEVCNVEGDLDVLDGITSLVDKSLLRQARESETRYSMLQTIWEYASERLVDSGQLNAIRSAHAAYFFQLAGNLEMELVGPAQAAWMRRLDRELDNLRVALSWLLEERRADAVLQLAGNLWRYWYSRTLFEEGRRWLSAGLALKDGVDPTGRTYDRLGTLIWMQGNLLEAKTWLEMARQVGDAMTVAGTSSTLGLIATEQGQFEQAQLLQEASLQLRRSLGDGRFIAHSLTNLGQLMLAQERFDEARVYLEEAIALSREAGDSWYLGIGLGGLGRAVRGQGDDAKAMTIFRESLRVVRDLGERTESSPGLWGLAQIAADRGDTIRAARLAGARWAGALQHVVVRGSAMEARVHHEITAVRSRVEPEVWDREWEVGRAMSLEEAIAYALEEEA